MDVAAIAQRFPLVARPRPTCPHLAERIGQLRETARAAHTEDNRASAAAVQNMAALIASDCGLHDLARTLCWRHFDTYLNRWPLDAPTARHALEPLVNIARLLIRTRDANRAHHLLNALFHAVSAHGDAVIDGRSLSFRHLTNTEEDRHTLLQWLWTVLLADGTRALTSAGRWQEALAYVQQHKGIGRRLLDGRQVSILAQLHASNPITALTTISQSDTTEPWERAVAACLTALCTARTGQSANAAVTTMIDHYLRLPLSPEVVLFQVRLGLTVTDIAGITGQHHEGERATARLVEQALTSEDGYAAQEVINNRSSRTHLTVEHERALSAVVRSTGLNHKAIPQHLITDLLNAAEAAQEVTTRQQNAPNHAAHG
ncbi:hypothetical protein AB0C87_08330 [Actinomadura sp. NPDC048021]|uniref:hypothetical protein n=1 Tax=Actinomadura sp. NPDC048021 TaxID=3155385 RepID=UPI0033E6D231